MTQKIYKTAKGKPVDIGSLRLQNENVRAVGNMKVNARGDRVDAKGTVIDSRDRQLQRNIQRNSNVTNDPVHASVLSTTPVPGAIDHTLANELTTVQEPINTGFTPIDVPADENTAQSTGGGLAAAIARSKVVKQELESTPAQKAKNQGIRKI